MSKLLKFVGLTAVLLVFSAVLGISAVSAASSPILYVTKNKSQININEQVNLDALSVVQDKNGTAPDSISYFVGNDKNPTVVCEQKHYCGMGFYMMEKGKGNKWFTFTIKAKYKDATTTKIVYVFVTNKVVGKAPQAPTPVTPAIPAADESPAYNKIVTSNHQVKVGEKFTMEIYPKNASVLSKIDVYLDGSPIKTCDMGVAQTCAATTPVMMLPDVGEHKYEFLMTGKNGKTLKPWGQFWVNAEPENYAVWGNVYTSGETINVGKKFTFSISAKYDSQGKPILMEKVEMYLDDKIVHACVDNVGDCGYTTPEPFTASAVGAHTYKIAVTGKGGMSTAYVNGKFQVVAVEEKDTTPPTVFISSNKETLKLWESATLTATATDNKSVAKIQILLFNGVVKECVGVNTCVYQLGPVTDKTYVGKFTYSAIAYDTSGNMAFTDDKSVTTNVLPTVSIVTTPPNPLDTSAIMFNANASAGNKTISYIEIMVNSKVVKACRQATSCGFMGGPYKEYSRNSITYLANLFFTDGSMITTGEKTQPIYSSNTAQ